MIYTSQLQKHVDEGIKQQQHCIISYIGAAVLVCISAIGPWSSEDRTEGCMGWWYC
jgi:hypothetical protein